MPRASPLLPLLLLAAVARAAEVFVIADSANQTIAIADAAERTIAEANAVVLSNDNDTLSESESDHEPVVRKKRTFGDIVFRGLADVLGYNVARKAPQVVFPPPVAPVPGIDSPLQSIPLAAAPAPPPAPPCGRAAAPQPCKARALPAPPPPKPTQPPCPKPRAVPRPKPKPKPQPKPQPPPCGSGRANPTTPSPCAPAPPAAPPPKADSNLETITSNFRLDFNFNRAPAPAASEAVEVQPAEQEQEQVAPVPSVLIRPQAAKLPPEPPRNPRVYLDAFVVQNGVPRKIHTIDVQNVDQHRADNDYLVYDDVEEPQPAAQAHEVADDDYDYVQVAREPSQSIRDFGSAVDQFWMQDNNKKKELPTHDYRTVHFGDRDFADRYRDTGKQSRDQNYGNPNQFRDQNYETHQPLQKKKQVPNIQYQPFPKLDEEEDEVTTTTQDPRRRLKPRILPPTEKNPNQIDTVTVRVPPIYKEKRPKKLHRQEPERPDRSEESEDMSYLEYAYHGPVGDQGHEPDADSENSEPIEQTEKPKRKRRRKNKRKTRSVHNQHYTAGDYDYFGKKLPISKEEEYFRGLTIPPPTKDSDLARIEQAPGGDGHFLDDHERLRDDPERIKNKRRSRGKKQSDESADESDRADESERSSELERSDESERSREDTERSSEKERADETERTDRLGPNARVRETGYKSNYVRAHNVQVDDAQPFLRTVKRKKTTVARKA